MEIREDPAVARSASSPSDPPECRKGARPKSAPGDGNIGPDEAGSSVLSMTEAHADTIRKLQKLFTDRQEDLDLALMKVIAEGGSPAEWLGGMLGASIPKELAEPSPRPRFLGE